MFEWIAGHEGNAVNERCDQLATQAAAENDLPPDWGFEKQDEEIDDAWDLTWDFLDEIGVPMKEKAKVA